jgi:hypothetical protein
MVQNSMNWMLAPGVMLFGQRSHDGAAVVCSGNRYCQCALHGSRSSGSGLQRFRDRLQQSERGKGGRRKARPECPQLEELEVSCAQRQQRSTGGSGELTTF